jgi:hypothetical protein
MEWTTRNKSQPHLVWRRCRRGLRRCFSSCTRHRKHVGRGDLVLSPPNEITGASLPSSLARKFLAASRKILSVSSDQAGPNSALNAVLLGVTYGGILASADATTLQQPFTKFSLPKPAASNPRGSKIQKQRFGAYKVAEQMALRAAPPHRTYARQKTEIYLNGFIVAACRELNVAVPDASRSSHCGRRRNF